MSGSKSKPNEEDLSSPASLATQSQHTPEHAQDARSNRAPMSASRQALHHSDPEPSPSPSLAQRIANSATTLTRDATSGPASTSTLGRTMQSITDEKGPTSTPSWASSSASGGASHDANGIYADDLQSSHRLNEATRQILGEFRERRPPQNVYDGQIERFSDVPRRYVDVLKDLSAQTRGVITSEKGKGVGFEWVDEFSGHDHDLRPEVLLDRADGDFARAEASDGAAVTSLLSNPTSTSEDFDEATSSTNPQPNIPASTLKQMPKHTSPTVSSPLNLLPDTNILNDDHTKFNGLSRRTSGPQNPAYVLEQWWGVLTGYMDEVWGPEVVDIGELKKEAEKAREQGQNERAREVEGRAVRRLRMVLGHLGVKDGG